VLVEDVFDLVIVSSVPGDTMRIECFTSCNWESSVFTASASGRIAVSGDFGDRESELLGLIGLSESPDTVELLAVFSKPMDRVSGDGGTDCTGETMGEEQVA
jgi:hypothetical protein